MAHKWRLLDPDETMIYNYGFDGQLGYAVDVCRVGHIRCECLLSKRWTIFRPHDPGTGSWPVHYLVSAFYVSQYLERHPELEACHRESCVRVFHLGSDS